MLYLLSLAVNLLSIAGADLGILIAEGAVVVGAGAAVTVLGVKINKKKKAQAQQEPVEEAEEPAEEPAEESAEEPVEEPAEEPVEEPAEESTEEPAEESTEEVTEEKAEEATEEKSEEVEDNYTPVDFEKYNSTSEDAEEIKRYLEESKETVGQETPTPEGDGQSWDQVKDYNAAVLPIVAVGDEEEEGEGDDNDNDEDAPEAPADDELKTIIDEQGNELQLTYRRSFRAKVIQSDKVFKDYYSLIVAELLSYKKVKSRPSWSCESFTLGRKTIAKLVVRGKTLALYLALNPGEQEGKYHLRDCSEKRKYADVPSMMKVRSTRAVKFAKELIAKLMDGVARIETPKMDEIPYEKTSALVGKGLIKVIANGGKVVLSDELMQEIAATQDKDGHRYSMSFQAKMIRADENVKKYYSEVKNELLSYKKVKSRYSWACETFNLGRDAKAKTAVRGKTLYLYLALDPKAYEGTKYFFRDLSDKKKYASVPMMVKIKSDRGLKYAKELISAMLEGVTKLDREAVDYTEEYQDMGQLIKGGLVKELPKEE